MKITLITIAASALVLVGCKQDTRSVNEPAGAEQEQIQQPAQSQQQQEQLQEPAGAPQPEASSDSAIEARVREALTGSKDQTQPTYTSAQNIMVSSKDGVVTLKGTVKSDAEKADFEAKAKAVSGVKSVDNQIEVKP